MKKCFGYVRVSTAKQGEGVSLEAQREAIERFAAAHDISITKWFEERETAAKSGRPVFNSMIQLLKRRRASGVVLHKVDRGARNALDWARIGLLSDAGVDVHFAAESLDFRSRGGRLSADIQAVIAADYIRNLREETIKGLTGRLRQGLYPFKAPIGYTDNGKGKPKTPDPARAPLITQAFELYGSAHHSLRSLQAELARLGLRNMNNQPLSKHGLEAILRNPFYCGLIRIRKTGATYQGVHEPLISVSLFERVQDIKGGRAGKKVTRHNHTYRGLFRCQNCGSAMTPSRHKGHVYYRCQTRDCPTTCVREEKLETAIEAVLSRIQLDDMDVGRFLDRFAAWCKSRRPEDSSVAKMQLGQIDARLERLTDALLDRLIDEQVFATRKERLMLEKMRLQEMIRSAISPEQETVQVRRFLELIKSLAAHYVSAKPQEKREIVQIATSNRTVIGKNVCLEPSNWLSQAELAIAGPVGDPHRPTSRRLPKLQEQQIMQLAEVAKSEQVHSLDKLVLKVQPDPLRKDA